MKHNMGINRALEIIDLNYSVNQGIFSSWPYSLIQINRYKCLTFSPLVPIGNLKRLIIQSVKLTDLLSVVFALQVIFAKKKIVPKLIDDWKPTPSFFFMKNRF